jgi:UDP-N-acetylmuramoyl-tripeptide--D-alanyl-D-alanine ligase
VAEALAGAGIGMPPALDGKPGGSGGGGLAGISTDSRTVREGEIFVALSGPSFDGSDFVGAAFAGGAAAAVAPESFRPREAGLPAEFRGRTALVADTLAALGSLARFVRGRSGAYLAAVTGSVGKTTVKDMLKEVFLEGFGPTLATEGNFNNRVGVPWTLFRLEKDHRAAVLELGAGDFGEMAALAGMALPDLALVTRVERAHLETFGDVAGVARAKFELFANLPPSATAVVSLDDPLVRAMGETLAGDPAFGGRIFTCGREGSGADAELAGLSELPGGGWRLTVRGGVFGDGFGMETPVPGAHNAWNAFLAAAAGAAAGLSPGAIAAGLARASLPRGRGRMLRSGGLGILDSSYNASPGAVAAELERLSGLPGPRGALLSDMLEMGETGPALHREVGRRAAAAGLDYLALAGDLSRETLRGALDAGFPRSRARHFGNPMEAAEWARAMAGGMGTLLVKGSHATGLWKAVGLLAPEAEDPGS